MSDAIIVALIGLLGSGIGGFCGIMISSKLTQYRLEQLEHRVEEHNEVIERTYILEGKVTELEHDVRDIKSNCQHCKG